MKKLILLTTYLCFATALWSAPPDEGMWLPMFINRLNYVDMQKMGLHLTTEELYNINNSSLKDAIVMLDGGQCTAEVVSPEGLIFTNHHCGYEAIQAHSSIEHDYLTNGFWAMDKKDELKNEDMTVSFLIRMEDVTDKVLKEVKDTMSEYDRNAAINKVISKIEKEAEESGKYEASVKSFFDGNEFYMFVYQTYEDIRLVGAPPSSIGKFGGDTDNWMWPRHTGDFSIFRIYTGADDKPAKYSEKNIPLKTKHFLPISLKGVKNNDFAMVWGYPGKTDRYLTSEGVKVILDQTAPAIISIRDKKLKLMKEDMDADPKIKIKYAAKYSQTANYWKYYIGQSKGLNSLKVYQKKKDIENNFNNWANNDPKRKTIYGNVINDFASSYKEIENKQYDKRLNYYQELLTGAEALYFSFKLQGMGFSSIIDEYNKSKDKKTFKDIKESANKFYKDYNMSTDKKIFAAMMEMFYKNIPKEFHPDIFETIVKKYKGDFKEYADYVYNKSIFGSEESFNKFLNKPKAKRIKEDPISIVMTSIIGGYFDMSAQQGDVNKKLKITKRLFVKGLKEMTPNNKFYPNANSTMRMSYGKVMDYDPADAVHYDFETTLKGLIDKEDPTNEEFIVPEKLKELFEKKDFGRYAENGKIITCFIANLDITGGNSGSPVINSDGELIGIAFDGNWEAMSGDIAYETSLQRTICVDIRYVMFIIDKYAGATNLIKEMTFKQ